MPLTRSLVAKLVESAHVEKAQAFDKGDQERILEELKKAHDGVDAFNTKLKLRIALQPLSYRVDLDMLTRRAGPAEVWDMSRVREWMAMDATKSRALVIVAGPGAGKRRGMGHMLCACEIVPSLYTYKVHLNSIYFVKNNPYLACTAHKLFRLDTGKQQPKPNMLFQPSPGKSTCAAMLATSANMKEAYVGAHHFFKYSDARRQDLTRVVQSLAFQLVSRCVQQGSIGQ